MLHSFQALFVAVTAWMAGEPGNALDAGYRQMYNLEFAEAHKTFAQWIREYPADPLGPVSDAAAYLFSELDRLHILQGEFFMHDENFRSRQRLSPDPAARQAFEGRLAEAGRLIEQALQRNSNDVNALFAKVLMLGLRSDYDGLIEKKYLSSLSTTKAGRATAERLLALAPDFHDAWLAIGVENYLLSLKPMPVRWFLQLNGNSTDREIGLAKLKATAEGGRYLKPFAKLLLAVAALRANDRPRGRLLLQELSAEFPHNHLYTDELARLQ